MPRSMPALAGRFRAVYDAGAKLVAGAEAAKASALADASVRRWLHPRRLEILYEVSYLRLFTAWEDFLEQTFLRYLCGYENSNGRVALVTGRQYCQNLIDARATVYGQNDYILWHNPRKYVIQRSAHFFSYGPHEAVASSALAPLERMANIRHRIAHDTDDSRVKFDAATMAFCGKRYPGGRPGRFLRDVDHSGATPQRYLKTIAEELMAYAGQICP